MSDLMHEEEENERRDSPHPFWKQRVKKFFLDFESMATLFFLTSIVSLAISWIPMYFLYILFGLNGYVSFGISTAVIYIGFLSFFTYCYIYDKDTEYDEKIILEKKRKDEITEKKRKIKEMRQQAALPWGKTLQLVNKQDSEMIQWIQSLKSLVDMTTQDYLLTTPEHHYLHTTVPNDISDALVLYEQLNPMQKEKAKESFIHTLEIQRNKIETDIIAKHTAAMKTMWESKMNLIARRDIQ